MHGKWLAELWRYRELVYFLAWRDVKVKYKQAALGVAWAVLQPLLAMVVFTVFFGRVKDVADDPMPYPLFCFCALVLWVYFSGVIGQASQSLLGNANLLTKVYFPRIALPVSTALSGLIDFVVGLAFLVLLMVYYGVRPGWEMLWAPVFLASLVLLAVGIGLLLAALTVSYRDLKHTVPFFIQIWMFATPVIYPATLLPERLQPLLALNPVTGIVEGFRWCLFPGRFIDPVLTAVSLGMTVVVFLVGVVYFRKTERAFADVI